MSPVLALTSLEVVLLFKFSLNLGLRIIYTFLPSFCLKMDFKPIFYLYLHGMFPHKGQLWWIAFLSLIQLMSQPWWSCCVTSVPLTSCWGAVWLLIVSVQVGGCSCYRIIPSMVGLLPKRLVRILCLCCALLYFCGFSPASVCDLRFEVRPESATSISVTFHQPQTDCLAVCKHLKYFGRGNPPGLNKCFRYFTFLWVFGGGMVIII